MQLTNILISLVATASATDLRGYFGSGCGGSFRQCGNVGSGVCCIVNDGRTGSPSVQVLNAGTGTQLFGYQTTRDGQQCGAIAGQVATGGSSSVCLNLDPNIGQFSACRWYPPGLLKRGRETCPATSTEECTGTVTPDQLVLADGHMFTLNGLDEDAKEELYAFAANGSAVADLPKKFAVLEQDEAGVAERLRTM